VSEHLTKEEVRAYKERAIAPAQLISLDKHVAACAECRRVLSAASGEAGFSALVEELKAEPASEHLAYEQLAAYADGAMEAVDAEIAESHLAVCAHCELQLSDLQVFKDEIKAGLGREYRPPAEMVAAKGRQSLFASLGSLFSFNSRAWAAALGAVVLVASGLLIWLAVRSGQSNSTQPVVQSDTHPAPQSSPQETSGLTPTPEPSPAATPQVLLALKDGSRQVALDERGNLTGLDELPPAYRQMIKAALSTQQAASASALTGLRGRNGSLRGGANNRNGFGPLDPVGIVVLTMRPVLRWARLDGATYYTVSIYDANFNPVATSPELSGTTWTVSSALGRGQIYSWQVTAIRDGQEVKAPVPPAAESKFKVLDAARAAELSRARQNFAGSHLTLGVLYAEAGLLDEAEREFLILLRENPQSKVAQNLLQSVRAQRRGR
jgi:hypothetical protein